MSGKSTAEVGYKNRNGQVVIRATRVPGTDHQQFAYELRCQGCGYRYYANGSDIHERLCPKHQGGRAGLLVEQE